MEGYLGLGNRNPGDGLDPLGEGTDPRGIHHVSEVPDLRASQHGLVFVDGDAMSRQEAEQGPEVLPVLLLSAARHQYIIQIYENGVNLPQDAVHHPLKGLGGVLEPKRHPDELIQAERGDDGGFRDVFRGHGYLVEPPHQIHDREDGPAYQVPVGVVDVGQGVPVILGDCVEAPVVSARSPRSISLRNDVQGRCPWRVRLADDAQIFHPLELGLGRGEFGAVQPAGPGMKRWTCGLDMVPHGVPDFPGEGLHQDVRKLVEYCLVGAHGRGTEA